MDRTNQMIDTAFLTWERQQRQDKGEPQVLACSSGLGCILPPAKHAAKKKRIARKTPVH
jgi:hypothetical protein